MASSEPENTADLGILCICSIIKKHEKSFFTKLFYIFDLCKTEVFSQTEVGKN